MVATELLWAIVRRGAGVMDSEERGHHPGAEGQGVPDPDWLVNASLAGARHEPETIARAIRQPACRPPPGRTPTTAAGAPTVACRSPRTTPQTEERGQEVILWSLYSFGAGFMAATMFWSGKTTPPLRPPIRTH